MHESLRPTTEDYAEMIDAMDPDELRNYTRQPDAVKYRLAQAHVLIRWFKETELSQASQPDAAREFDRLIENRRTLDSNRGNRPPHPQDQRAHDNRIAFLERYLANSTT